MIQFPGGWKYSTSLVGDGVLRNQFISSPPMTTSHFIFFLPSSFGVHKNCDSVVMRSVNRRNSARKWWQEVIFHIQMSKRNMVSSPAIQHRRVSPTICHDEKSSYDTWSHGKDETIIGEGEECTLFEG